MIKFSYGDHISPPIFCPSPFIKHILRPKQWQKCSRTEGSRAVSPQQCTDCFYAPLHPTSFPTLSGRKTGGKVSRQDKQLREHFIIHFTSPHPPHMHMYKAHSTNNSQHSLRADYESGTVLSKCFAYVNSHASHSSPEVGAAVPAPQVRE